MSRFFWPCLCPPPAEFATRPKLAEAISQSCTSLTRSSHASTHSRPLPALSPRLLSVNSLDPTHSLVASSRSSGYLMPPLSHLGLFLGPLCPTASSVFTRQSENFFFLSAPMQLYLSPVLPLKDSHHPLLLNPIAKQILRST